MIMRFDLSRLKYITQPNCLRVLVRAHALTYVSMHMCTQREIVSSTNIIHLHHYEYIASISGGAD